MYIHSCMNATRIRACIHAGMYILYILTWICHALATVSMHIQDTHMHTCTNTWENIKHTRISILIQHAHIHTCLRAHMHTCTHHSSLYCASNETTHAFLLDVSKCSSARSHGLTATSMRPLLLADKRVHASSFECIMCHIWIKTLLCFVSRYIHMCICIRSNTNSDVCMYIYIYIPTHICMYYTMKI